MTPSASAFESREADWLPVEEAVARVLEAAEPIGSERVPLLEALGRSLAESIDATVTLPPWDNSAMDGYAVCAADLTSAREDAPVTLRVTGIVHAGAPELPTVTSGTCVRIMTGAPVPPGADAIVRVEDTDAEAEPGTVRVRAAPPAGKDIRRAGKDMRRGDRLLERGRTITAGCVGVLAATGYAHVPVGRVPTVALMATGDELRPVERFDDVSAGRGIPDSNRPMLAAMTRALGCTPLDLGIASDDAADLESRIRSGSEADVLVTIGGASMGEADLVKRVLTRLGYEPGFWRAKMRPGSPVSFGWLPWPEGRRQPVIGLPGNPSSAFVTFEVFVRPFLLRAAGHDKVFRPSLTCRAGDPIDTPAALTYFQRVTIDDSPDGPAARLTGPQGSGLVSGLARADGLAVIPPEVTSVSVGDPVRVLLLDGARAESSLRS